VGGFALSFLIYNKVISAVNVGRSAIVLNLIPAFGLMSSMVFLGEEPTPQRHHRSVPHRRLGDLLHDLP
jgi:drug/metabolite transporter (DMT)-like permease